jgi:hypothetical protein
MKSSTENKKSAYGENSLRRRNLMMYLGLWNANDLLLETKKLGDKYFLIIMDYIMLLRMIIYEFIYDKTPLNNQF